MSGWGSRIGQLGKGIATTFATAGGGGLLLAGAAVAAAVPAALSRATELEAIGRRVGTVFGESTPQIQAWADNLNERLGASQMTVQGLAASVGDLLVPMGFARTEAAGLSERTVELAGALRSWTGNTRSAEEVTQILTAAMLGERDALQSLGVQISQADIDNYLLAQGQENLTGKEREQAEALATLELAYAKSGDAVTAWNERSGGVGPAMDRIKAAFADARDELITRLGPSLESLSVWVADNLPAAVDTGRAWIEGTLIPAFGRIRGWWDSNGPAVIAAVQLFIDFLGFLGRTAATVWEGISAVSDAGALIVTQVVRGLNQVFLGFAEEVIGAMITVGKALPGADPQWVRALEDAKTQVTSTRQRVNAELDAIYDEVIARVNADTGPARRSIDEFMASYRRQEIAMSVNLRGLYGDGEGIPGTGGGRIGPAAGYRAQMGVLNQAFGRVSLISGFRPGSRTRSGALSYHARGRAVDIPPDMRVFNWIRANYGAISRELIFSPAGGRQIHNGRPHLYTGGVRADHFDHVHWALQHGGVVPGRRGSPQLIVAHGGETVLPTHKDGEWSVDVVGGRISRAMVDAMLAAGWRGRLGDRREALYQPGAWGPAITAKGLARAAGSDPAVMSWAGEGGDGPAPRVVLEVRSGGSQLDQLLVDVLRRAVRVRGGNVQLVLGG